MFFLPPSLRYNPLLQLKNHEETALWCHLGDQVELELCLDERVSILNWSILKCVWSTISSVQHPKSKYCSRRVIRSMIDDWCRRSWKWDAGFASFWRYYILDLLMARADTRRTNELRTSTFWMLCALLTARPEKNKIHNEFTEICDDRKKLDNHTLISTRKNRDKWRDN